MGVIGWLTHFAGCLQDATRRGQDVVKIVPNDAAELQKALEILERIAYPAAVAADEPADVRDSANEVQQFAEAMKAKMHEKAMEGYGGWEQADVGFLAKLLVDHIPKGDPVDIANFAMMLFHREGGAEALRRASVPPNDRLRELEEHIERMACWREASDVLSGVRELRDQILERRQSSTKTAVQSVCDRAAHMTDITRSTDETGARPQIREEDLWNTGLGWPGNDKR